MSRRHLIGLPKESPLRRAARIVDRSGAVDLLERWRSEDRARAGKGLGGRPKHVSDRAVLVAWVALAIDKKPMIVIDMADLIATADQQVHWAHRLAPIIAEVIDSTPL